MIWFYVWIIGVIIICFGAGFFDLNFDGDDWAAVAVWPLVLVVTSLIYIIQAPYQYGRYLYKKRKEYNNG